MAIIGKIRKHSGLVVIIVGVAIAAFVIGDFSKKSVKGTNDIGTVNGESIPYTEFNSKVEKTLEIQKENSGNDKITDQETYQLRQSTWTTTVKELLMGGEYEELGLTVSPEELFDQIQGKQPHRFILQYFKDPATGQYNPSVVLNYLKNLDKMEPKAKNQWLQFEKAIKEDRQETKFNNLLTKAYYVPKAFLKKEFINQSKALKVLSVSPELTSISDSSIKLTDTDYQKFYDKNKIYFFMEEASRDLDYVLLEVKPSDIDRKKTAEDVTMLFKEFQTSQDAMTFTHANSDTKADTIFVKKGTFPAQLDTLLFAAKPGAIFPPFELNSSWYMAKLLDMQARPDSMKGSQILLAFEGTGNENIKRTKAEAKTKIDSLMAALKKNPQSFAEVAKKYSDYPSAKDDGGDLKWFKDGNPNFDPFFKAGLELKPNEMKVVETRIGYSLFLLTEKSAPVTKVKAAVLTRAIVPSNQTFQDTYMKASAFAGQNKTPEAFEKAAIQKGPRYGFGGTQFADLSKGFDGDYRGGFINRWRLIPRDPAAYARGELVEPVTPITYYLDPGIPAPYREALREGGNWWAKVFEAAGFRNAFRVLDLPAGADPMDARYNMLMWIHRNGPGPSVGPSYSDPRTGEIVRAVVRMDAWRSLIDYNIWAGTVPAFGAAGPNVDAESFAMSRRRQHAAHEIGHTIGLQHNYIASSQGRTSVMDYPFPLITANADGSLDLRDAWRKGPGAWDSLAIKLGYTWYPTAAAEKAGLATIMKDGLARNVRFINDTYAGANGSIPQVTRWDEGTTMFDAVTRSSRVRRILIDKFDERAIQPGEPMAMLNMRFTHVYLHHRYSLEALAKYVGGMDFTFTLRGDGQVPTRVLPAADQRKALNMALDALKPSELTVPERVIAMIPPPPPGFNTDMTWIDGSGGTAFDQVTLAGGLANEVVGYLLDRERAARLVLFQARDANALGLDEVLGTIVRRTWGATAPGSSAERAVLRASQRATLDVMLDLAGDKRAMPDVRAQATLHVRALDQRLAAAPGTDAAARAHVAAARRDIARFVAGEDTPESRPRYPVITLPWP